MPGAITATFLNASTAQRLEIAKDGANAEALTTLLGRAAYEEYRHLAEGLDTGKHLAFGAPTNVVFIPGIMGSLLQSRTLGGIWWIDMRTRDRIDQLALAPDGSHDAEVGNDIVPTTSDPAYDPFLRALLMAEGFGHEIFAYDWRKSLTRSARSLRDAIVRIYGTNGGRAVHIVAHSMGGLLARAALLDHGDELWPKLGRIVFIGTPHYGAPAIAGYLKNHLWGFEMIAVLGLYLSRATLRSLWGVVDLLPAPRGIYPGTRPNDRDTWRSEAGDDAYVHPCANFDLYDAGAWRLELDADETARLQTMLNATAHFHRRLYETHRSLDQSLRDRMTVIAGVGYQTLFRIAYEPGFLGLWERAGKITHRVQDDPHRDGDGRVPLASAALENVSIRYARGVHGGLPNIPAVSEDVLRCLKNEAMQLPRTARAALGGHLGEEASRAPHLDGSALANRYSDDPGLWHMEPPPKQRLSALQADLIAERLPEFTRVRLL
jgi:pimeloyl-ACP methyl ester carboxylesterase